MGRGNFKFFMDLWVGQGKRMPEIDGVFPVVNVSRSTNEFYVFCMSDLNYVSSVRRVRIGYGIMMKFDALSFDMCELFVR